MMDSPVWIKRFTFLVAVIFLIGIGVDFYINKKDEKILKMQLEAVENYNLRKDRLLKLNNTISEIFINYDQLETSSLILTKSIKQLQNKYPTISDLKEAVEIIDEQNSHIDYIKLYNTKVFHALKGVRESSLLLFKYIDIADINSMEIIYLTRKINDAFADIRSNRKVAFQKVRENIRLLGQLKVADGKLENIKDTTINHSFDVLSNILKLKGSLKKFNILEEELDNKYKKVKREFEQSHNEISSFNEINRFLVIILFVIFIYLIYKLLKIEKGIKKELDNLIRSQEKMIKDAVKDIEIQKEKALLAARSKAEFLANMSHEIRTPLNGILGFVDILKESVKDEESKGHLKIIDNSSQHLLGIINDILDYSKIESGKMDIEKIDFNIKEELGVTIDLFKAKASEKHIFLNVSFSDDLPKVLNGDPLRIKQVISNFLSNAIKFTNNEEDIDTIIDYKEGVLSIRIKDRGIGISNDKLRQIFEPFSQEDTTTTRKFGGTGLGLSICKELVALMGGEIKIKSELGKGSEFGFYIPAGIGKEIVKEEIKICNISFEGKKLLLVEDNDSNIMFMKVILKKLGFDFDIAKDGLEAIEAFKKCRYDYILMDENMPNMGGIEAMKNIRTIEKEKNLSPTIIIALTANALKGDRERFLEAGMDEYLTKPLKRKRLEEVLSLFE